MSSRTARLVGAVVLAGAVVPLVGVQPAAAASSTEAASAGAYFYEAGVDKPDAAPAAPPNVTGSGDFVSPGNLAVAVTSPGRTNKKSFLQFDLAEVPFDAVVSKAVVSVPLAENGNGDPRQNRSVSAAASKVRACPADATGFNGEDGQSFAQAPKSVCDAFSVTGEESADKTAYEFEITALVAEWLAAENNGMSLEPTVDSSAFQVVFQPFDEANLAVEYTAPAAAAESESPAAPDAPSAPDVAVPVDTGSTGGTGAADLSGGFDAGVEAPVLDEPSIDTGVAEPPALAADGAPLPEAPAAADAPAADAPAAEAPEVAGAPATTPIASGRSEAPLTPAVTFWAGSLLVAALLALVSLIVGDTTGAAAATTVAPTRLGRALQQGGGLLARPAGSLSA